LFDPTRGVIANRQHTAKTDVWTIEITLFALATCHFPFQKEDESHKTRNVLQGGPEVRAAPFYLRMW
jgi:hypothetical protein